MLFLWEKGAEEHLKDGTALSKAAAVVSAGVAGHSPRLFLLLRSLFRRKENAVA